MLILSTQKRLLLIPLFVLMFSGCNRPIQTVASPVDVPEAFVETGNRPLPEKWWEVFDDAGLNAHIERAMGDNFDVLIAWDRLGQAEAVAVKEGADLLPKVDASGGAKRTREETGSVAKYSNRFSAGITVGYEVDLWGRIRAAQQGAMLDVQARREDVDATAIVLSANIANVWYQLADAKAQIDIIRQQIEINEKVLSLITSRFQQGQAGAADVLRQRQLVASSRGQLIPVQEQSEVLLNELAVLVGATPGPLTPPENNHLIHIPMLPMVGIPSELLQRRPDVRSAYLAVQAADQRLAEAIADQYPRISLSGSAETYDTKVCDLFDNWIANLAGNLTGPVFDGGFRRAEADRNRALVSQAIHEYGRIVLSSLGEVQDALIQERRQGEYVASLEKQIQLARNVMEQTRNSYIKGQLEYLRVLEVLVSLQNLEQNYITAKRVLISRRIDLCRAIAGGWPMEKPALANLDKGGQKND